MELILTHGYPYPYPPRLDEARQHELSEAAAAVQLVLTGVRQFEQLHTTTVEFASSSDCARAQALTGWPKWGMQGELILEALTSARDGYDQPALVAGDTAYCGWRLVDYFSPDAVHGSRSGAIGLGKSGGR